MTDSLRETIGFFDHLSSIGPYRQWLDYGLLLAVSGGTDSTAMLHLLARFAMANRLPRPKVGHINHRLRGVDSDRDERFVRDLCTEYDLGCFVHQVRREQWEQDDSGSREAAGRRIRYEFLIKTAEQAGCRYLATAHTADDRTETVLHRIFRGTGPTGLGGITRFRQGSPAVTLVRPLLEVRRTEIIEYLRLLDRPFCQDTTNLENDFTRNRLRNLVLPLLRRELNPKVDEAILRLADLAEENEAVLADLCDELLDRLLVEDISGRIVFETESFRRLRPATVRELLVRAWKRNSWPLRDMGREQWTALADFLLNGNGSRLFPGAVLAEHRPERVGARFSLQRVGGDSETGS